MEAKVTVVVDGEEVISLDQDDQMTIVGSVDLLLRAKELMLSCINTICIHTNPDTPNLKTFVKSQQVSS